MHDTFYVYILTNKYHNVFYTGFTNVIYRRTFEHKEGLYKGFINKYNLHKLVYYEEHREAESALRREYLIKRWKKQWEIDLVNSMNPSWKDLFEDFVEK